MKKLIALLLAAVLVLSMAACSQEAEPTNGTEPTKDLTKLDELYWRDSYTASDADAAAGRETTIGFVGETELTNGMLQVLYWNEVYNFVNTNNYYLSLYGLDPSKDLDTQSCVNTSGTWQHYFLKGALENWHCYAAMALMAKDNNTPMDDEFQKDLDGLMGVLKERAEKDGFDSVDALIQAEAGAGCTAQDYYDYSEMCYLAYSYFNKLSEQIEVTDAQIEQYFNKHQSELANQKITKDSGNNHSVRHILIEISGGTKDENGKTVYSETDWDNCRDKAQKLLDQWLAGEHTEDTFADYAKKHSADPGSSAEGGLYTGLNKSTNFVEPFKEWYLTEGRQVGDYGLVKTDYGYHIMYYSGTEPQWITACRDGVTNELCAKIVTDATDKYPAVVVYEKILLGNVVLLEDKDK